MTDNYLTQLRQMRRDGLRFYCDPDDSEMAIKVRKECAGRIQPWHKPAIEEHRKPIFERLVWEQALVLDGAETCSFCHSVDWPKPFPTSQLLYLGQQIKAGEDKNYVISLFCQTCGESRRKERREQEQRALGKPLKERGRFIRR